jgi:hypothetical protein
LQYGQYGLCTGLKKIVQMSLLAAPLPQVAVHFTNNGETSTHQATYTSGFILLTLTIILDHIWVSQE